MYNQGNNLLNLQEEEENFWPTFTDLLSVIILVILLVLVSYIFMAQISTQKTQEIQEMINERINEIIGFREKIARDLNKKFSSSHLAIDVDEKTEAIIFSGEVLFRTNSARIRPEFKKMLEKFIPKYVDVLLAKKYRNNISQIIIEGHTDDRGSYMYNLDLSQRRAFNVVKYILSDEFPDFKYKDRLKNYITANGKSESVLIKNKDDSINRKKSRRVVFKFNLKDRYLINKMKNVVH